MTNSHNDTALNRRNAIAPGVRLECPREIAERLFGKLPPTAHTFQVTCNPALPLKNGGAVGARFPHNGAWCIGYVRTKHPENARHVVVEFLGEAMGGELKFNRADVVAIAGVIGRHISDI